MSNRRPHPIPRSEAARLGGVTKGAITAATKPGGALAPAALASGRLNASHPRFKAWLQRRRTRAAAQAAPSEMRKFGPSDPTSAANSGSTEGPPPTEPRPASPQKKGSFRVIGGDIRDVAEISEMTIRQVVRRWGTVTEFKDWLDATKALETIREKNLRNAETEGNLISKKLIVTHVMGALEAGNRRLLSDTPKTMARRLYAAARADVPIEEAEQMVREIIGSHLRPVKEGAVRLLRGASEAMDAHVRRDTRAARTTRATVRRAHGAASKP